MSEVTYLGVKNVPISRVDANPLSANEEDGATFSRLKEELKKYGLVELPVAIESGDRFRVISGHHRVAGWREIGHEAIDVIVLAGDLSKEDEFNLVNNMNTIRGQLSVSRVKRVIRGEKLDVSKLDLFKYPITRFMPPSDAKEQDMEAVRRAKVRDMSLVLASKIAEVLLDKMDDPVVVLRVGDVPAAVVRLSMSKAGVRRSIADLRMRLKGAFREWLDKGEVSGEEPDEANLSV